MLVCRRDMHQKEASWESRWAQQELAMQRLHNHIGLEPPSIDPDPSQGPGQSLSSPTSAIQQVNALPYSEQRSPPQWHTAHAFANRHLRSVQQLLWWVLFNATWQAGASLRHGSRCSFAQESASQVAWL